MLEVDSKHLAKTINDLKDAVDKSSFGPMFQYPDKNNLNQRQINQLAFGVFTIVLTAIMRDYNKSV